DVVAVALSLSASVLLSVADRVLLSTVDESVRQQADTVRVQAGAGTLTTPIRTHDGTIVQVIDADGRITHVTYGADRLVPLLDARARARALAEGRPCSSTAARTRFRRCCGRWCWRPTAGTA